jgi:hypothetical protein
MCPAHMHREMWKGIVTSMDSTRFFKEDLMTLSMYSNANTGIHSDRHRRTMSFLLIEQESGTSTDINVDFGWSPAYDREHVTTHDRQLDPPLLSPDHAGDNTPSDRFGHVHFSLTIRLDVISWYTTVA